ncbi:MAG: stage III sporulation protein AB [Clostridia bacterium]|nr:stage III sporulation protein AB [Clostridia bacterium]
MGLIYVLELRARRCQLMKGIEFLRYLRREIRWTSTTIPQLIRNCPVDFPLASAMDCSEPFDLTSAYREALDQCGKELFFRAEEREAMDRLFLSLGQGDLTSQEECLKACEETFLRCVEGTGVLLSRNGKSAVVLGASFGAVLVLLLL